MIRGVIIEGLSTTGKTSVFSAIKKLHSQTYNSEKTIIAISEHYSQVLHSYQGTLRSMDKDEHIQLLNCHVDYLEQQYNWIDSLGHTKPANGAFYLLERFHVNHRAAFLNSEIEMIEKRLSRLNAHCVLLTLSQEAVEPRFIEGRSESWRSYVMENHSTVTEACQKFLEDQENLRMYAKQSLIPTLEINTDEADWDSYAKRILMELRR
ncbi:TPA: hypothetical protein QFG15_002653 [Enterococcus faecium]|uniref:hypothetical protein n=1 Tax=Aerococcus urinaeequi TaxID=51665 RepID=UPI0010B737AA|nr:hypothetical protein [Listeria monocytogenes]NKR45564.1 hypothetical protein [Prescottella equi]HAQ3752439.1 hypothetical protein [Enterococcus faecium]EAC9583984.1 hypothetical protein [Listeria monocytogenes]EAD1252070.1 hypothetical protein [Listeria monocytogenes]